MAGNIKLLAAVVLAWLALGLGLLAYRIERGWYRSWRYGPPLDHSSLLVEYGRRMTAAPDRWTVAQLLTNELPLTLQVERAALLLPESRYFVAVESDSEHVTQALRLSVSHAAVRWVA